MNLFTALSNDYQYGGIREAIRKTVFWTVYKASNLRTIRYVKRAEKEFGIYTGEARTSEAIVSLTSFSKRFGQIGLTLKSLIIQSVKPDKIIVYFANDMKPEDLTDEMREYEKYGIEYRFDSEQNLKSHTKYYYAMQDFPEAIIVTADDDKVYPKNWLRSLLESYHRDPDAISARRAHLMSLDENGNLTPYNSWIDRYRGMPHLHRTKVVWVKNWKVAAADTANVSINALSAENAAKDKNDIYIQNLIKAYNIDPHSFFDRGITYTTLGRAIIAILLLYILLSDSRRAVSA